MARANKRSEGMKRNARQRHAATHNTRMRRFWRRGRTPDGLCPRLGRSRLGPTRVFHRCRGITMRGCGNQVLRDMDICVACERKAAAI